MNTKPSNIDFVQFHQPSLESGEYRISVHQTLDDVGSKIPVQTEEVVKTFFVAGERFHILPEHIKGVFPPPASLGDHSNVFPHLMLSRNTLPWERESVPANSATPWLALLVIHESEAADAVVSVAKLGDLRNASNSSPYFPGITGPEPGHADTDKVAMLDIRKGLLEQILPDQQSLNFLTHIRQGKDDDGQLVGADLAVLVANRLPQKGMGNTVHLVSLESRYTAPNNAFDYQNAGSNDLIRLVKLHSWSFTSTEHFKVSESFLEKVSNLPQAIRAKLRSLIGNAYYTEADFLADLSTGAGLTAQEILDYKADIFTDFAYGDFALVLKHLDRATSTLRLPDVGNAATDVYLKTGFYPLPHQLRRGGQTVSWYHGPLAPQSNTEAVSLPAQGADALLRYYDSNGMFDVSYAAAWELGRLLALQNTHFSTELYQWKRRYAKCINAQNQLDSEQLSHLKGGTCDLSPETMPASVKNWLTDLALLKGVPFNYLVPDEELLPVESIRFFQLDRLWSECLLDGAFSIGRVTSQDHLLDESIRSLEENLSSQAMSGFLLRSEVVSGFPEMEVEGFSTSPQVGSEEAPLPASDELRLVRREKLSPNVLLCLFEGTLETLDLHLQPEVLHFGVNLKDGGGFEKELRDNNGLEHATFKIDVPFSSSLVVDLSSLLGNIQAKYSLNQINLAWDSNPTSAELAFQMLEGVERVRFLK